MAKITILGAGTMGCAFSVPCSEKNHEIKIIGTHLEDQFVEQVIQNDNFHSGLNLKLSENIKFIKHSELSKEKNNLSNLIILGVSSKGINWSVEQLKNIFSNSELPPILMLTKGLNIYKNRYELLVDNYARLNNLSDAEKYCTLGINNDSNSHALYARLSGINNDNNDFESAIVNANEALTIKRNYGPALIELGRANVNLCNKVAAEDALNRAKRYDRRQVKQMLEWAKEHYKTACK